MKRLMVVTTLVLASFGAQAAEQVDILQQYIDAWAISDASERTNSLTEIFSEDGNFLDPQAGATGASDLSHHIGVFQSQFPGADFKVDHTKIIQTGNYLLYTWELYSQSGVFILSGEDFVSLDQQGKIKQVVGFWH